MICEGFTLTLTAWRLCLQTTAKGIILLETL